MQKRYTGIHNSIWGIKQSIKQYWSRALVNNLQLETHPNFRRAYFKKPTKSPPFMKILVDTCQLFVTCESGGNTLPSTLYSSVVTSSPSDCMAWANRSINTITVKCKRALTPVVSTSAILLSAFFLFRSFWNCASHCNQQRTKISLFEWDEISRDEQEVRSIKTFPILVLLYMLLLSAIMRFYRHFTQPLIQILFINYITLTRNTSKP